MKKVKSFFSDFLYKRYALYTVNAIILIKISNLLEAFEPVPVPVPVSSNAFDIVGTQF